MKIYCGSRRKLKVGDYVEIIGDSFFSGDWGVIQYIDEEDDEYHVAIANGNDSMPMFSRNELKLMKYRPA